MTDMAMVREDEDIDLDEPYIYGYTCKCGTHNYYEYFSEKRKEFKCYNCGNIRTVICNGITSDKQSHD